MKEVGSNELHGVDVMRVVLVPNVSLQAFRYEGGEILGVMVLIIVVPEDDSAHVVLRVVCIHKVVAETLSLNVFGERVVVIHEAQAPNMMPDS